MPAEEPRPCPAPGRAASGPGRGPRGPRGSGDVRTGAQRPQIQIRVVPAHPVEQPGQSGGGPGGDEELGAAGRGHRHRPQRQPHPLHPHQGVPAGCLGDVEHVEGPAHGEQYRGARHLGPGIRGGAQGGARRHLTGEVQRVRAGGRARGVAARAGARRGTRAGSHRPAPESCVLGHRGRAGPAAATPRAGPHLPDAADREAHAPSNGSDSPVVTTRRPRRPPSPPIRRRAGWRSRGACHGSRAPECFTPPATERGPSSESRTTPDGFTRRGGEWWRFSNDPRGGSDRRITVGTRTCNCTRWWVCPGQPGFLFDGAQRRYGRHQGTAF